MDSLFRAVREACSSGTWSRGVEMTRRQAVLQVAGDPDEVVLRVLPAGRGPAATVTLFPGDDDWDCPCGDDDEVCAHVAAAAIAWRRAATEGKALPTESERVGRLEYRFVQRNGRLDLRRVVVRDDDERLLEGSLRALRERDPDAAALVKREDMEVERVIGRPGRGPLPAQLLPDLFRALARCEHVRLDDQAVQIDPRPLTARVVVNDQGDGFLLFLAPDPSVTRLFRDGIVLCDDTLRLQVPPPLTAREREDLERGISFSADQVGELVGDVLPRLKGRLPVDIDTRRLPRRAASKPRLVIDVDEEAGALSVLPVLVYGDPPVARVDDGRLVHLEGAVPVRQLELERLLEREVRAELGLAAGERTMFHGEEAVSVAARLEAWQGQVRGSALSLFALVAPLRARFDLTPEGFRLDFMSEDAGPRRTARTATAGAVMQAWSEGSTLVPLDGGGWAPLPADWLGRYGHQVADLLAARRMGEGKLPAAARLDLAGLCEDLGVVSPPDLQPLVKLLEAESEALPAATLPADLQATLRHYQQGGVDWLALLGKAGLGALLADDMGLGKTLQALCAVRGRTLVVAPTSVVFNWRDEIRRFRPGLSTSLYHGPDRTLDPGVDVTLTTYALLRLDVERLAAEAWETIILDEAQNIKNPTSQAARAACRLPARVRIALSGTPVENRLEELWSLLHFLNPGLLGSREDFRRRYGRPVAQGEQAELDRLRRRIRPFVLRRRKAEVAPELPPRTDVVRHCELSEEERRVYEAVRAATRDDVVAKLEAGGGVMEALEALLRLRQACCHPSLVPGQTADTSAKLEVLLGLLTEIAADGHKALVFSQWTSLLDRVEPRLQEAGLPFVRLDGSTRDRGEVVGRFQSDDGPPVMLISLKAGGTGLNLTAADHVMLLDPWWNPAVEDQAADRAHRIGQERPVLLTRLVARDTVEERILALQDRKRALAEAALGGGHAAAALDRDDLLALLA